MLLWTAIIILLVRSSNNVRLPSSEITFSSDISVSDEVCGYLRHIDSGTCVGAKGNAIRADRLLAANSWQNPENFCFNTTIREISLNGYKVVTKGRSSLLWLSKNKGTSENSVSTWRLLRSGEIQSVTGGSRCWKRNTGNGDNGSGINGNENDGFIELESNCDDETQQFDFQRRREVSGHHRKLFSS
ncbi:hypothetical protein ACHWQZ_G005508 [Mnemiopsis leidyi]